MQAIKGYYDDGKLTLDQEPPVKSGRVSVVFVDEETHVEIPSSLQGKSIEILRKYAGRIKRDIDIDKERDEYLNEKYGPFD
jgi:hypothetical protein